MHTKKMLGGSKVGALLVATTLLLSGCDEQTPTPPPADKAEISTKTNRTPIPPVVRQNLGITFATASYRPVASTITLPGHFEVLPSAQHHYPLPAAGRVTVRVSPLQTVTAGQLLLEIDAPDWRSLQIELADAKTASAGFAATLAKARATRTAALGMKEKQGREDRSSDGGAVYDSQVAAAEAELEGSRGRFEQLLAKATSMTGLSTEELTKLDGDVPHWRSLTRVPVHAAASGVVREVDAATGTWVAGGTEVVHVVQPNTLRFRARALQADLFDGIQDGQPATIVPPEGRGNSRRDAGLAGTVRIGVTGNPATRTMDVFIDFSEHRDWARPHVAALAEVIVAGSASIEELAIPTRAVIQDGLEKVFFRRASDDPDEVIRTVADLGATDGRWVAVLSGLAEGDEVVVDGIYELKLATSATKVEGGHFHADGTWHEEDH